MACFVTQIAIKSRNRPEKKPSKLGPIFRRGGPLNFYGSLLAQNIVYTTSQSFTDSRSVAFVCESWQRSGRQRLRRVGRILSQ